MIVGSLVTGFVGSMGGQARSPNQVGLEERNRLVGIAVGEMVQSCFPENEFQFPSISVVPYLVLPRST